MINLSYLTLIVPQFLGRNAAEALLYADWWTVAGELEVAGASGSCGVIIVFVISMVSTSCHRWMAQMKNGRWCWLFRNARQEILHIWRAMRADILKKMTFFQMKLEVVGFLHILRRQTHTNPTTSTKCRWILLRGAGTDRSVFSWACEGFYFVGRKGCFKT